MRIDAFLTQNSMVKSREQAKRLIESGKVTLNGKVVTKPSKDVSGNDKIEVTETEKYVGRGAYKLLKAFDVFDIDVGGKVCADLGASTGGFTQVLLEKGAEKVYAVDVGHGQLDKTLLSDKRVINREGVNVRELYNGFFDDEVTFVCGDLSFISLRLVLPPVLTAISGDAQLVLLIKPQFEAGKDALNKKGVVRDKKKHIEVLQTLCDFFAAQSLCLKGLDYSPISGGDGNIEYLAFLEKGGSKAKSFDIKSLVEKAQYSVENKK